MSLLPFKRDFASLLVDYPAFESTFHFSCEYDARLSPKYTDMLPVASCDTSYDTFDEEFLLDITRLEKISESLAVSEATLHLLMLQSEDALSCGLIMIELYTSKPFFSSSTTFGSFEAIMHKVYSCSEDLPLCLKRIISLPLHPRFLHSIPTIYDIPYLPHLGCCLGSTLARLILIRVPN